MKIIISLIFLIVGLGVSAQNYQLLDTIQSPANYDNIYNRPLYSDSLSSSFVIFIKKEVKLHKHIHHTEQVTILEGEGEMVLGDKKIEVKKGSQVFIPKGTPHALKNTGTIPVKVLSVQAPYFDGKDRVFIE